MKSGTWQGVVARARWAAMVLVVGLASCAEGPLETAREATVTMRFLTPATVRALIVDVSGPGIEPAVTVNVEVGPDTVATRTLTLPAGSARRFVVTAVDTAGVATHRADTTITLQAGTNPALAMRVAPLSGTLGITVTFGGARVTVAGTATRTLAEGDTVRILATATRGNGSAVPADSLEWGSENPAIATVTGGLVTGIREGSTEVTVSYQGISVPIAITVVPTSGIRAPMPPAVSTSRQ